MRHSPSGIKPEVLMQSIIPQGKRVINTHKHIICVERDLPLPSMKWKLRFHGASHLLFLPSRKKVSKKGQDLVAELVEVGPSLFSYLFSQPFRSKALSFKQYLTGALRPVRKHTIFHRLSHSFFGSSSEVGIILQ